MEVQLSADQVVGELSPELRRGLAVQVGSTDQTANLYLILLPRGSRLELAAYGVIELISSHEVGSDDPVDLKLTPFGRRVISAAALALTDEDRKVLAGLRDDFDRAQTERQA